MFEVFTPSYGFTFAFKLLILLIMFSAFDCFWSTVVQSTANAMGHALSAAFILCASATA
jgi:hypothetical protein